MPGVHDLGKLHQHQPVLGPYLGMGIESPNLRGRIRPMAFAWLCDNRLCLQTFVVLLATYVPVVGCRTEPRWGGTALPHRLAPARPLCLCARTPRKHEALRVRHGPVPLRPRGDRGQVQKSGTGREPVALELARERDLLKLA